MPFARWQRWARSVVPLVPWGLASPRGGGGQFWYPALVQEWAGEPTESPRALRALEGESRKWTGPFLPCPPPRPSVTGMSQSAVRCALSPLKVLVDGISSPAVPSAPSLAASWGTQGASKAREEACKSSNNPGNTQVLPRLAAAFAFITLDPQS